MPTNSTATEISPKQRAIIKRCLDKIAKNRPTIQQFKRYYDGDHELNFASEKFTTQFAKRLHRMRDNLCKTVVRAPADRLEIIGFSTDAESSVYVDSWAIWKRSQMPRLAKRVHRDAFKTGDAFVLVWADAAGNARIVNQDPEQCCVFYNPETAAVEFGAKVWRGLDDYIYLTIYTPEVIEKYVTDKTYKAGSIPNNPAAYKRRVVENEKWPVENTFGVCPLFHFGLESSILSDVIPLNDALNKEIADMLIGSEANSLRQRWTAGITYETDPETGKQIIPFERSSQWFASQDPNAKFGEFQDVALEQFLKVIEDFRMEIASVAGVPHYYFRITSGDFPSGEALTKAESRFTSLIADAQLDFGETWAAAEKLAMRIDGKAIGDADTTAGTEADAGDGTKQAELETQWKPAAPMSDNEKADLAIKKKQVGVSEEQNLSEMGYTDAQIKKMQGDNQKAQAAKAEAFSSVFDAGGSIAS